MKFAFSTVSCPAWDFDTLVTHARQWGYEGVELSGGPGRPGAAVSTFQLAEPDLVRKTLEDATLEVACIASSAAMSGRRDEDARLAQSIRVDIDLAQRLGCRRVKLCDREVRRGQDRGAAGIALGEWLLPLGDYAAERDVTLVVENALGFRRAREMWTVIDRIAHPAVACCWNLFSATRSGEGPDISVPVLNSRIQYAYVTDATVSAAGTNYCKLGEGSIPVHRLITRLRGIGYGGFVTFQWEAAPLSTAIDQVQDVLADAVAKLKVWRGDASAKPPTRMVKPAAATKVVANDAAAV